MMRDLVVQVPAPPHWLTREQMITFGDAQVTLRIDDNESLASIISRAAIEASAGKLDELPPFAYLVKGFGAVVGPSLFPAFTIGAEEEVRLFTYDSNPNFGDLVRAREAGFISSDLEVLDLLANDGLGGGEIEVDLVAWLADNAVLLLAGGFVGHFATISSNKMSRTLKLQAAARSARIAAAQLNDAGISTPSTISEFLALRDRWSDQEIARRLRVERSTARDLLRASGHMRKTGTDQWALSNDPSALSRRRRWDAASEEEGLMSTHANISPVFELQPCARCAEPTAPILLGGSHAWYCRSCGHFWNDEAPMPSAWGELAERWLASEGDRTMTQE
jgi:hypothetical protein